MCDHWQQFPEASNINKPRRGEGSFIIKTHGDKRLNEAAPLRCHCTPKEKKQKKIPAERSNVENLHSEKSSVNRDLYFELPTIYLIPPGSRYLNNVPSHVVVLLSKNKGNTSFSLLLATCQQYFRNFYDAMMAPFLPRSL